MDAENVADEMVAEPAPEEEPEATFLELNANDLKTLIRRHEERFKELRKLKAIDDAVKDGHDLDIQVSVYLPKRNGERITEYITIPARDDLGRVILNSLMVRARDHADKIWQVLGPDAIDLDALIEETE